MLPVAVAAFCLTLTFMCERIWPQAAPPIALLGVATVFFAPALYGALAFSADGRRDRAAGRAGDIRLVVEEPRREGNQPARNDLSDEDHPASRALPVIPHYVEAQVDLFEVAMTWNADAQDPGVKELERHHAYEGLSLPQIESGTRGHPGRQQPRRHLEARHDEMAPFG